jgi:hypothetical protein
MVEFTGETSYHQTDGHTAPLAKIWQALIQPIVTNRISSSAEIWQALT